MVKLLIAEAGEAFSTALADTLSSRYQISRCSSGEETLCILEREEPDILVINLALPHGDGLYVLRNMVHRPPLILALTTVATDYILQATKDAGAEYVIMLPCTVKCVVKHLDEMQALAKQGGRQRDPQRITEAYLNELGLASHRSGFTQLRVGVPLFAQDERQLMKKELYPAIAKLCGNDNPEQVEHTIRESIKEAWENRGRNQKEAIWKEYFPGKEKAPSNKAFIAVLAQKLRQQMR